MDGTSINHRHFHPHLASHTTSAVELQTKVREDFTSTYHLAQCLNSDVNALVGSFEALLLSAAWPRVGPGAGAGHHCLVALCPGCTAFISFRSDGC